jgi:2-oxoglutarate ferredoxin oxidoreductase subunit alpha
MVARLTNEMSILIGGSAGQGVESGGAGVAQAFARAGLHVFAMQDFRSRIRGGHNFFQMRLSESPVYSHRDPVHLVVALTPESVALHMDHIAEGGAVIFADSFKIDEEPLRARGISVDALPLTKIAEQYGDRVMTNTAALGATAGITGFPVEYLEGVIRENFAVKGQKVVDANLKVVRDAYDAARERYGDSFPFRLAAVEGAPQRLLMNGNEALALGALAGGCRFISAYPMTPATSVIEWLAKAPAEYGVVTKHTEDEIAAVCMALGASFAGARAMTATSGGGFSLMVEAMGLSGITEVPIVMVDAQRGGPSTGMPTHTEQSDLLFVVHASQGEFPRVILAPGTVEQCFEAGWRSFNLADRYQCPVVILTDTLLASSLQTVDARDIDFNSVLIDRGKTLDADVAPEEYKRFAYSEDGVSPRAFPGSPQAIITTASDEHDESGHISEASDVRIPMMQKRMRKLETARNEMRLPEVYGPEDAEITLISWGSTHGTVRHAVDILNASGESARMLHFVDLWPLPEQELRQILGSCRRTVVVEQNYTSQLGMLLRMTTGFEANVTLTKYDGRPFGPDYIAAAVRREVGVGNKA